MKKKERIEELERNIRNCDTLTRSKLVPQTTKTGLIGQKESYQKELKKLTKGMSK